MRRVPLRLDLLLRLLAKTNWRDGFEVVCALVLLPWMWFTDPVSRAITIDKMLGKKVWPPKP